MLPKADKKLGNKYQLQLVLFEKCRNQKCFVNAGAVYSEFSLILLYITKNVKRSPILLLGFTSSIYILQNK